MVSGLRTRASSRAIVVGQLDPALTGSAQRVFLHIIGSGRSDSGFGVAVQANGDVIAAGDCWEAIPVTPGAYLTVHPGVGSPEGFVLKLTADGASIRYATYLGLNGFVFPSNPLVSADGTVTIVGHTSFANMALTPGAIDSIHGGFYEGFVMQLSPSLAQLQYATYIGGNADEYSYSRSAHMTGSVLTMVFDTPSSDLPVVRAFQGRQNNWDTYLIRLDLTNLGLASAPRDVELLDLDGDGDLASRPPTKLRATSACA